MYSKTFVAAALLAVVAADFDSDAQAVSSIAASLSSQVAGWSAGAGLAGALGIQSGFPNLVSAVDALSKDAGSLSKSNVKPDTVNSLASAVVGLLSVLTSKASDFTSVSANGIVSGDIKSVQPPAVDILNSIVGAVSGDSGLIGSLTAALSSYESAFDAADEAYGIDKASWPAVPTGGAAPSSSAAAATSSAAAASSAPASSSAAASSAAAATSKAVATSAAATSAASSAPAVANGASNLVAGAGVAAAGALALLL